jgi:hypothetical protein
VIPIAARGSHTPENVRLSHVHCNLAKATTAKQFAVVRRTEEARACSSDSSMLDYDKQGCETTTNKPVGLRQSLYMESETSTKTSPEKRRATRLSKAWTLPEEWREWAVKTRPDVDPDLEATKMRNWSLSSKNGAKLDWEATWHNWIFGANPSRGSPSSSSNADFVRSLCADIEAKGKPP